MDFLSVARGRFGERTGSTSVSHLLTPALMSTSALGDAWSEETRIASFFLPLHNVFFRVEDVNVL